MKLTIQKEKFLTELVRASAFCSDKINANNALRGVYIETKDDSLVFRATDLNKHYYGCLHTGEKTEKTAVVLEVRTMVEFLQLLQDKDVSLVFQEGAVVLSQGTKTGTFSAQKANDFPLPPKIKTENKVKDSKSLLEQTERVLFSASRDETRPILTGVNIFSDEETRAVVSTDGFRLSLYTKSDEERVPNSIVPSPFLRTVLKQTSPQKATVYFSEEEKTILVEEGETKYFSRLLEGAFPPYKKVLPTEHTTHVEVDKEELQRNVKLISIFAREQSNVVVFEISKNGLLVRPKRQEEGVNKATLEVVFEGDNITIAFNYKYVLDFLQNATEKTITIDLLRPDAPVVFREQSNKDFIHVIMPVRIQE